MLPCPVLPLPVCLYSCVQSFSYKKQELKDVLMSDYSSFSIIPGTTGFVWGSVYLLPLSIWWYWTPNNLCTLKIYFALLGGALICLARDKRFLKFVGMHFSTFQSGWWWQQKLGSLETLRLRDKYTEDLTEFGRHKWRVFTGETNKAWKWRKRSLRSCPVAERTAGSFPITHQSRCIGRKCTVWT